MARNAPNPRALLSATILVLVVLALAPTRFTRWVGWFRNPLMILVAPLSGPLAALSSRAHEAVDPETDDPRGLVSREDLQRQLDEANQVSARALERVRELESLVTEYQRGVPPYRDPAVRKLEAARIGVNLSAGTIDVSRGSRDGVTVGSVAIARRSQHLVGIVTSVGPRVSTVHLITDRRLDPPLMVGLVVSDDVWKEQTFTDAPRCQLKADADGTLVDGAVPAGAADRMQTGHLVVLSDPSWPSAAQYCILGRITRIEPTDSPHYRKVVVTPQVDVSRVRSVILNIPEAPRAGGAP